jgi:hypothetical protein
VPRVLHGLADEHSLPHQKDLVIVVSKESASMMRRCLLEYPDLSVTTLTNSSSRERKQTPCCKPFCFIQPPTCYPYRPCNKVCSPYKVFRNTKKAFQKLALATDLLALLKLCCRSRLHVRYAECCADDRRWLTGWCTERPG